MSTHKLIRAVQRPFKQIGKLAQMLTKSIVGWLLRGLLLVGRRSHPTQAGFVLPTVVLLLLVVTLTVGSITFRTFTRTADASYDKQQRVIYNSATPAIDRAKAKLEFLFDPQRNPRYPNGVPPEGVLLGMMLNDGTNGVAPYRIEPGNYDPYLFPDEERLDLDGDGAKDTAWWYRADLNGDGDTNDAQDGIIAYSVLFETEPIEQMRDTQEGAVNRRAGELKVRNGPLSINSRSNSACARRNNQSNLGLDVGWFRDEVQTSLLKKNFQVDALVLPNDPNGSVSTLEFFQDREVKRGNKWGAWFRNDLEIFPGPDFNWNGAMHTEGNLIVGKPSSGTFTSYLISGRESCLFDIENSVVTVTGIDANPENQVPKFYGQVLSGLARDNNFGGNAIFHLQRGREEVTSGDETVLNPQRDSVDDNIAKPADYALDPIELQTKGVSKARNVADPQSNAFWESRSEIQKDRIFTEAEVPPYVDDSYRADDRYGPRPRIQGEPIPGLIGEEIGNVPELTGNDPAPGAGESDVGLDGYWERRAQREGLRLIVGQRLELGNAFGWNGPTNPSGTFLANEPLRPWSGCSSSNSGICNEARQRRTLRDNLPAVQATAVYHAASTDRTFPLACLATTVHHGTGYTLARSATFEDLNYDLEYSEGARTTPTLDAGRFPAGSVISDFFRGRGTNGWEYQPPRLADFSNAASPMRKALKNLAYFAGDPLGGAPSFTPDISSDRLVHPFPSMAMWGDFSMLRRVIEKLDSGTAYADLSPADKSTLHTAACTIGMLAHNVQYLYNYNPYDNDPSNPYNSPSDPGGGERPRLDELRAYIKRLWNEAATPPATGPYANTWAGTPPVLNDPTFRNALLPPRNTTLTALATPEQLKPEGIIAGLERWRDLTTDTNQRRYLNRMVHMAQMIATKEQVFRDIKYGFRGSGLTNSIGWTVFQDPVTGAKTKCFRWYEAAGNGANLNLEPLFSLCSRQPRYPALAAIFANTTAPGNLLPEIPNVTRDSEDSEGINYNYISSKNVGNIYQRIDTTNNAEMDLLALRPRRLDQWVLPNAVVPGAGGTPNSNQAVLIRECYTPCSDNTGVVTPPPTPPTGSVDRRIEVAFKDSALFNGRELMSVRALDMNINLMRNTTDGLVNDSWLPKSGIIYAFREDAVSEGSIYRPASGSWSACGTNAAIQTNGCRMRTNVSAVASTDPPLNPSNYITPKPVDYYPDPDRRPYGFRIRNGVDLGRAGDNGRGMTLVSDNPVYIQGNFNVHQNTNNQPLEEFTELLRADFSNFYSRSGFDDNFARGGDRWRPAEILADAVTILSSNFCDGSAEDAFLTAGAGQAAAVPTGVARQYNCAGNPNVTSYLNQNRPRVSPSPDARGNRWQRENLDESRYMMIADSSNAVTQEGGRVPILVNREGNPVRADGANGTAYNQGYFARGDLKALNAAAPGDTRVNSIIVSGIVPTRPNQSYGGLHNFPRFLENWDRRNLYISGSFLQLNFSNYATGPFDQDAFEAGAAPVSGSESIRYYDPPNRRWGYDVGLQIAPAGPLAQRFISLQSIRSEFYNEPPADDPYIKNLCAAIESINPQANCP